MKSVNGPTDRLAVLIDAENVSYKYAAYLVGDIGKKGVSCTTRLFGDFSSPQMQGWLGLVANYALTPVQVCRGASNKNVSDIALTINAMDLVSKNVCHGFCIVSSDSDFSCLANRIREDGRKVFGYGEEKTPVHFRLACNEFNILSADLTRERVVQGSDTAKKLLSGVDPNAAVLKSILAIMKENNTADGWIDLAALGSRMSRSGLDCKSLGYSKLSTMFQSLSAFDLRLNATGRIEVRPAQHSKHRVNERKT